MILAVLTASLQQQYSEHSINSAPRLAGTLHTLLRGGRQRPHVYKLLRQPRTKASGERHRPFIELLIEILSKTEEEAHATGKDSSIEGIIGLEATDLLYEVLRVKRLSKEELPLFSEAFITHLFDIVEQTRDGDEAYNFTVIRLIVSHCYCIKEWRLR